MMTGELIQLKRCRIVNTVFEASFILVILSRCSKVNVHCIAHRTIYYRCCIVVIVAVFSFFSFFFFKKNEIIIFPFLLSASKHLHHHGVGSIVHDAIINVRISIVNDGKNEKCSTGRCCIA